MIAIFTCRSSAISIMRATILLVVCFIIRPALFAQDELYTESQLQGMKQRYAEWQKQSPDLSMTVEFDPAPQALDMPHPRFSWISQLKGRCRKQSAFQILVAGSLQKLQLDEGDCWNSGWVTSDQSSLVYYAGKPLQSNTSYYWKVRIRDEAGKAQPFGKVAEFRTALMKESDWTAGWIGRGAGDEVESDVSAFVDHTVSPEVQRIQPDPRSPMFRNEFSIVKKVHRANIFIAGLGLYELRLNGAKVGKQVLAVSRTDFRKRILYDSYDVTDQLRSGRNAIGILLGNGWFNGQKKYWGWQMQWYGSPRVIMQLEIEYEDGSKERIATNRHWKAAWSPITFNCLFDGEHYDARLEQKDWDRPGFDDSQWSPANEVASPGGKLASRLHEPGLITAKVKPVAVTEPKPGIFVFDLGQNITGWVKLRVKGPAGTEIKMHFAERMRADGMINASSANAALQEDHYILKGEGEEVFEPRFTYHGFQYIEVRGFPGKPDLESIEGQYLHTAVSAAGSFSCSNDLINHIHYCMLQSQRCNIQMGVPTDDTQRPERQGWGGDAVMSAQEAMLNFTMQRVYTKWLGDFRDQQDAQGRVSCIVPRAGIEEDLVWSSSFVLIPWYQYIHYGDTGILKENYDAILRYMNFLARSGRASVPPYTKPGNPMLDDTILSPTMIGYLQLSQWGDHLSLSNTYHGRSGLPLSISTAFYYHDVQVMGKIAGILGMAEHAAKFRELAVEIKNAFNDRFLNKEKGYYDDGSQSAQAWPLYFGMVPGQWVKSVQDALIADIVITHKGHPTTGYVGTKYMIDQLTKAGRQDIVWGMLMNTDFPGWNYSLRDGRSTITERWDDGGSQNHVVLGAAIDPWFYTVLAGIRADENYLGYKKFSIQPYIPGSALDWVNASVKTAYGTITSSWKKTKAGLQFDFEIPASTTAAVYLPVRSVKDLRESGRSLNKSNSVIVLGNKDNHVVLKLESGSYHFEVKRME